MMLFMKLNTEAVNYKKARCLADAALPATALNVLALDSSLKHSQYLEGRIVSLKNFVIFRVSLSSTVHKPLMSPETQKERYFT
jgi:hypothetical protein